MQLRYKLELKCVKILFRLGADEWVGGWCWGEWFDEVFGRLHIFFILDKVKCNLDELRYSLDELRWNLDANLINLDAS